MALATAIAIIVTWSVSTCKQLPPDQVGSFVPLSDEKVRRLASIVKRALRGQGAGEERLGKWLATWVGDEMLDSRGGPIEIVVRQRLILVRGAGRDGVLGTPDDDCEIIDTTVLR